MQRERMSDHRDRHSEGDESNNDTHLNQMREEIDALLSAADDVFDSIDSVHAQQYLEQNLQTGGQ